MPALTDRKMEKACQEYILNGGDQSKAYRVAYTGSKKWKPETVHVRASKFFKEDKVRIRVAELQAEAAKIAEDQFKVDASYVLGRLVEIDQMDFADIFEPDGNALLPINQWPKTWRRYISGFDFSEIWEGGGDQRQMLGMLKKIKWPDKVKNLELLGKHVSVNAFRDQVGIGDPGGNPIQMPTVIKIVSPKNVRG